MTDLDRRLRETLRAASESARHEREERRPAARRDLLARIDRRRRFLRVAAAGAAASLVGAAVAGSVFLGRRGDAPPVPVSSEITDLPIRSHAADVAAGNDIVWVSDTDGGAVVTFDPGTGDVGSRIVLGGAPEDVDLAGAALWVSNPAAGMIHRLDAATGAQHDRIRLAAGAAALEMAASADGAWVIVARRRLVFVDRNGEVAIDRALSSPARDVAIDGDSVWLLTDEGRIVALDGSTGRPRGGRFDSGAGFGGDLMAGGGALWVSDAAAGTLVKLDVTTGARLGSVTIRGTIRSTALGNGVVWVVYDANGAFVRAVDVDDVAWAGPPVPVAVEAGQITVDRAHLWVTDRVGPRLVRIAIPRR